MVKAPTRKRLIEPKVRLLLWIYLQGIKNENNWRARVSKIIDYSTGSTAKELLELLDKGLIESFNQDKVSPPYHVTEEGQSFLRPILLTQKIGIFTGLWVSIWAVIFFALFYNNPTLMVVFWLPLLIASFIMLVIVLIFYPHILVHQGKRSYWSKSS
jgi:hypothetical protein